MADSLFDILSRRSFDEPEEALAIKRYVQDKFGKAVTVSVREREIIVTAGSAAFAGSLRAHTRQLRQAAATDKRLVFRIA